MCWCTAITLLKLSHFSSSIFSLIKSNFLSSDKGVHFCEKSHAEETLACGSQGTFTCLWLLMLVAVS